MRSICAHLSISSQFSRCKNISWVAHISGNWSFMYFLFYLIHSLTSLYNPNTTFYFKCHSQSNLKFVKIVIKITFSAYLLQRVSVLQGHQQATVNWSKWVHTITYLHAIIACRRIRECAPALSSCYFHVAAFTLCFFVRVFLGRVRVLFWSCERSRFLHGSCSN
jgi:hypothetical protein